MLVGAVVVEDDVDGLALGNVPFDPVEEADELLMPVALHVLPDDRSVQHVERGEERRRAVAFVVVGHGGAAALLQRQAGLGAVKRLYLRLFIHRQNHRMGRRRDVEPDHIVQLLGEGAIVRQLELTPAVRAQPMRLPDFAHRRGGQSDRLAHRPDRPVRRLMRRRVPRQPDHLGHLLVRRSGCARRARLLPQKTIETLDHEPLLPAPDTGLGLGRGCHDRRRSGAIGAQKNDAAAPDMLLGRTRVRNDRLKPGSILA